MTGHAHPPRAARGWRKGGTPSNVSVRSQRTAWQRGRGGSPNQEVEEEVPSKQRALPSHSMQGREGGPLASSLTSLWPRVDSAHFRVLSPSSSVSVPYCSSVAQWLASLPAAPVLA